MSLNNPQEKNLKELHDIAAELTGLSARKAERIKKAQKLWRIYREKQKGFERLYRLCVDIGVETSNRFRDIHVDPIGGVVNIVKDGGKLSYRLNDVAEALDLFYDASTSLTPTLEL